MESREALPEDVGKAVGKAAAAQPGWAALTDEERVGYLNRAADNIEAHAQELAYAIVREQGKTLSGIGVRYEIRGCVGWLRATAATPVPREVLVDDGANHAECATARSASSARSPRGTGR